ncbi:hypothetical protein MKW98_008001 [Papaver atlanticum]|uniref:poly(ADP-ribose) glycohydrolase n=1 Tax=Papaver atlanticum TaxID=357466 RepID=A0AAD4SWG9_9MAGN|nr:hypothetical protein MKW98_008001 [Papaver atlanticum]
MENLDSLNSILPFLPIVSSSSSSYDISWPNQIVEALKSLSEGPDHSGVDSGEVLFHTISNLRNFLDYPSSELSHGTEVGYTLFFNELMSPVESRKWFGETVPALATLLLKLPSLLEDHYRDADEIHRGEKDGYPKIKTGLRMLSPQESGKVFLSQELIGALLACSFFCLFPTVDRRAKLLRRINFDFLFANLHPSYKQHIEHKIRCLVHYFERISECMPMNCVSFERKVIPMSAESSPFGVSYPEAEFWRKSTTSLCQFEVFLSGLIEEQTREALEVDFANKFIGGGVMGRGCVQEEIRFMINPELIIGILFLPCMDANEAIEIVGAERFSNYTGYGNAFLFSGEYSDNKLTDFMGRRKTRIIAIDAAPRLGIKQFRLENLVREVNKAWCGFFDHDQHGHRDSDVKDDIGIATGNWGCGAFAGDPELKAMLQWLAASQALRPFISYYTFGHEALQNLELVTCLIQSYGWTVGDLWDMLAEYSSQRLNGKTRVGFFSWLLPSSAPPHMTKKEKWKKKKKETR